jgi:hypothetical protein
MKAYRLKKQFVEDGVLQLDALPFRAGERVEIIILAPEKDVLPSTSTAQGMVVEYLYPTEPVANPDWDALR